jgi:hypothetical protein
MRSRETRSGGLAVTLSILIAATAASTAWAEAPDVITFQGRLSNAQNSQPVTGCLNMIFSIYTSQNATTPIWAEAHTSPCVQVTNGQFSADLGSLVSFSSKGLQFDEQYFLGIRVGTDNEMNPRKPLTSVAYALHALHAQNSDHANNSDHSNNSENANNSGHSDRATNSDNADYATSANSALTANHANRADFALGVMEARVAEVMAGLRGGDLPMPGSAVYTSPVLALNDASTWCGIPSKLSPCVIKIMPGVYDLGASDLNMVQYVDIQGAGANVTRVFTSGTIWPADHSELSHLALVKKGMAGSSLINVSQGAPRISHITTSVPAATTAIEIDGSNPEMDHVTVEGCSDRMVAIKNGASPRISNSFIDSDCTGVQATSLRIESASSPTLTNVRIRASEHGGSSSAKGAIIEGGAKPIFENVQIDVSTDEGLGGTAIGVEIRGAFSNLSGVSIRATGLSGGSVIGINSKDSSEIEIDHCVIVSDLESIMHDGTGSIWVGATKLVGSVPGAGGVLHCAGAYDDHYHALNMNCE